MLDTNACAVTINRSNERVTERILKHHAEDIVTSVICAAELRYGAEKSTRCEEALDKLQLFLSSIRPIPLGVCVWSCRERANRSVLSMRS
jgi:predicted nucleic acid-binding protein